MRRTFHIETYGCQMNKCDSELMALSMAGAGFEAADGDAADIRIFNTCSVRAHAEDRALANMRAAQAAIRERDGIIVLAGCMAQRIGVGLAGSAAHIVVGPYQTPDIGRIVRDHLDAGAGAVHLSQEPARLATRINPENIGDADGTPWHKWLTITHGCENFCAYCIVPAVRGPLVSFPSAEIIDYAKRLADHGVIELTLLGQNVNQYGQDSVDISFARLLASISEIDGIRRVNFLTSHPKDFTDDIIETMRDHLAITRAIHLPMQSGSDRILGLMNRRYTVDAYRSLVDRIRAALVDCAISTDLIVGFPGETDAEFRDTLDAVESIGFDDAFMYAYSPREGTAAHALAESITREEKIARLNELIALQRAIGRTRLAVRAGATEVVIVERVSKKSDDEVMGKTALNHPVVLPGGAGDIGAVLRVRIEGVRGNTLYGERVE
ncbi:MAG TPA: tRNA (N6-isopentenyl adenosine(37)-C2)-methylthiotransferase MiaB [Spirochaetota bacterium]|nr:tRNA (N6-isopentenyl adenosine(37)-C2)-methylthiotransferase MiaB [Spirochaetota bacterium]